MNKYLSMALALIFGLSFVACGGETKSDGVVDADTDTDSDTDTDADSDSDTDTDADTDADTDTNPSYDPDQWIGSACHCEGADCTALGGVEVPSADTIIDCDDMPAETAENGFKHVCLRTYVGALTNDTWFANGYCALQSTLCDGASLICNSAIYGDFAVMTECPAGSVMLEYVTTVTVGFSNADVTTRTCALACDADADCRNEETDPAISDAVTQYECVADKDPVKFCYDARNLPADAANYTAVAF